MFKVMIFFWQGSSELSSTESTSVFFNLFILFNHLLLPRNSSYLVCFLHIWPGPEQSQDSDKFQWAFEETRLICM